MADDPKRTVHTKVNKTEDIEIHVSTLETEQGDYTDIREYVVSLEQYGRGITFPARLTWDIYESIRDSYHRTNNDAPGATA